MQFLVARLAGLALVLAGCAPATPPPASPAAASCGDARSVSLRELASTGSVFAALQGKHSAELQLACPSEQPCELPQDTRLELSFTPANETVCEFAACRVPYLGSLPFSGPGDEPCPKVMWSVTEVRLKTDRGTLDQVARDVNVLASARGEGFLRFMVDNPPGLATTGTLGGAARVTMLDVQVEIEAGRVRGRLSALAAPQPSEPASDLHFRALWTATWQSAGAP